MVCTSVLPLLLQNCLPDSDSDWVFFMLLSNYIIRQLGGLPPPGSAVQ
jgi:hypothetical protein